MPPQKALALLEKIEKLLWQRGFRNAAVRRISVVLLVMSTSLVAAGIILLPFTSWVFWLGVGAALSAWNFCSLADFVQRIFPVITAQTAPAASSSVNESTLDHTDNSKKNSGGKSKNGAASKFFLQGQLFRSYFRLFITGILVYTALVVCRANPFALAIGLSAAILAMPMLILMWPAKNG